MALIVSGNKLTHHAVTLTFFTNCIGRIIEIDVSATFFRGGSLESSSRLYSFLIANCTFGWYGIWVRLDTGGRCNIAKTGYFTNSDYFFSGIPTFLPQSINGSQFDIFLRGF